MFARSSVTTAFGPIPELARLISLSTPALSTLPASVHVPAVVQDHVGLDSKIEAILRDVPMIERDCIPADEFQPYINKNYLPQNIDADLDAIRGQRLFFPRLELIHLLLCGTKPFSDVEAIENGCGMWPHTAASLLELGCRVMVKEPDSQGYRIHSRHMRQHYGAELESGRLKYAHEMTDVDAQTTADIAYWVSPSPSMLHSYAKEMLPEYLGRDVTAGGFLVIQSDWPYYDGIEFNVDRWEPVISVYLGEDARIRGLVMATTQEGSRHSFKVFRRKTP